MKQIFVLLLAVIAQNVQAQDRQPDFANVCFHPSEARRLVLEKSVLSLPQVMKTTRQNVPYADVLHVRLCRLDGRMIYVMSFLRKNGQITHVTLDAVSGKIIQMR